MPPQVPFSPLRIAAVPLEPRGPNTVFPLQPRSSGSRGANVSWLTTYKRLTRSQRIVLTEARITTRVARPPCSLRAISFRERRSGLRFSLFPFRTHTRTIRLRYNMIGKSELSREAASRIVQFRISHTPVNHYLNRIQKVDSARCPACSADEETIEHCLLHCPSYAHKRWALAQLAKKSRKQLSMETLLGDPNMTVPLANYIDATQHFKTPGEQNQT